MNCCEDSKQGSVISSVKVMLAELLLSDGSNRCILNVSVVEHKTVRRLPHSSCSPLSRAVLAARPRLGIHRSCWRVPRLWPFSAACHATARRGLARGLAPSLLRLPDEAVSYARVAGPRRGAQERRGRLKVGRGRGGQLGLAAASCGPASLAPPQASRQNEIMK